MMKMTVSYSCRGFCEGKVIAAQRLAKSRSGICAASRKGVASLAGVTKGMWSSRKAVN